MKNRNILLGIVIIAISVGGVLIYNLIPQFETTEFDQESIIQISEGSTTTISPSDISPTTTITNGNNEELIDIQPSEIEIILANNSSKDI